MQRLHEHPPPPSTHAAMLRCIVLRDGQAGRQSRAGQAQHVPGTRLTWQSRSRCGPGTCTWITFGSN